MSKSNWHFWLTFFICVSLSLTLVQSASAAVTYVDHTVESQEGAGGPYDFEHIVPAGDDRYLLTAIHIWPEEADSLKFDGTKFTHLGWIQAGSERTCQLFGLALGTSATPDTGDIVTSSGSGTWGSHIFCAVNYTGVNQEDAVGDTVGRVTTSSETLSVSITTVEANSMIFGFATGADNGPMAPLNSQTERWDDNIQGSWPIAYWGAERTVTTAQAYDFGLDADSATNMALLAIEVKEAAASAVLDLDPATLSFTYSDSSASAKKFGIGNSGDGILDWETTNICTWLSESCADTGTVGAGYDSVTVEVKWAQVDSQVSWTDTVVVTGGGDGQVVISVTGKQYTVESAHPRLYFNSTGEATVIAKCKSALSTMYGDHKTWVDANLLDDTYPLASNENYRDYMKMLGLSHIVESPADTLYFNEMKDMLAYVFAQADWEQNEYYMSALGVFYDWANGELVAGNRDDFYAAKLDTALTYHTANHISWYASNAGHTKLPQLQYIATAAIALYGDGHADATATAAMDTLYNSVYGDPHCIAMIDSIAHDGGYFQGEYNRISLKWFAEACYLLWTGTTDLTPFTDSSCLNGWADYIVWDTWASAKWGVGFGASKQGDSHTLSGALDNTRNLVNMLTTATQDANGMWLEDQFAAYESYLNSTSKWNYIVLHDTLLAAQSPTAGSWPEAIQYDVGTVYMRDGWDIQTTTEDIWAVYRHEQYPFGHAQADAGHFIICRGQDPLLIDGGYYSTASAAHKAEYASQTVAHNCITILKNDETFSEASENTGGQAYLGDGAHPITVGAYTDSMATKASRGSITDFTTVTDTLVYIRSDLTDAYTSAKVDTVRREFVWLEAKNTFLIFDTVKLDSTGYLQKQLFHMIPNPTTLSATAYWTEGDSQAKLTSLFGTGDVTITEVGGAGHHFDCNGTNYGTEEAVYDEGDYRLELSPGRAADHRWMLTAIQVTAQADTSYSILALVEDGDYIGAAVDSDTVLFHKYGGTYATSGAPDASPVLALDPSTLNFTYAEPDSHSMKFGISNSGDGILNWETTNICDWLSASCVDTGTVGVGTDSVTVQVKWEQVAQDASLVDTVLITGDDSGQVIINATGESTATPDTTTGITGHRRTGSRRRGCGG